MGPVQGVAAAGDQLVERAMAFYLHHHAEPIGRVAQVAAGRSNPMSRQAL